VEAFRQVCGAFDGYCDAYCEAVAASQPRRRLPKRVLAVSGTAAVAAAVAAFLLFVPRTRIQLSPVPVVQAPTPTAVDLGKALPTRATQPAAAVIKPDPRMERREPTEQAKPTVAQRRSEETSWLPAEAAVEIAIPADAIFPPGAVPDDVSFAADVTIAADGSAQQIRLRPQSVQFERRSTRP
jgi:hypothetical protein